MGETRILRMRRTNNTDRRILDILGKCRGALEADAIVRIMWPQSRQPEKKAITVNKACRAMVRSGLLRRVGAAAYSTARKDNQRQATPAPLRFKLMEDDR